MDANVAIGVMVKKKTIVKRLRSEDTSLAY